MNRSASYNTRQREAVLRYIINLDGAHATAAQIARYFTNAADPIGRATIYRHLNNMTENGTLRRYVTDGVSGACYQLAGAVDACDSHLHLKCESCGVLQHLECEALGELEQHVYASHAFQLNILKTVLYGKCEDCRQSSANAGAGNAETRARSDGTVAANTGVNNDSIVAASTGRRMETRV